MDFKGIIKENKARLKLLNEPYDPVKGIGSPIKRFKFFVDTQKYIMLPETMKDDPVIKAVLPLSLTEFLLKNGTYELMADALDAVTKLRFKYDFEFWTYTCVPIQDKLTKEMIPFKLRKAQRKLLKTLEEERVSGRPVRVNLLKARQWGGSTMILFWFLWIQMFHKVNWHSAILATVEEQARYVRGMVSKMAAEHPKSVASITLKPFEDSSKNKIIVERGNILGIGSTEKPENLRTFDYAMLHMTELGSWKETISKSPEDLAQSVKNTVPQVAGSAIINESTAKGVGNYWHRLWVDAKDKDTGYVNVFIPWYEIDMYQRPVDKPTEFIKRMDEYAWFLWNSGATLEGINWYYHIRSTEGYSDWRMKSEFPTTDDEAFQSTGNRVFNQNYVLAARKNILDPVYIGELSSDASNGKKALQNISFLNATGGRLWVWDKPDKSIHVANRYAVFADIGGKTAKADWSVAKVFDRYPMLDGGVPEVVALWRGHLDQDIFAWQVARLAMWYNKALLAVETNSLRKAVQASEGDHFLTILDEIAPFYDNLYTRTDPDKVREGAPVQWGFHTTRGMKELIVNTLNAALRDNEYIERHRLSCDEMDTFEHKPDGSMGAVDGAHDDCVIVTAGGLWLSLKHMPMPAVYVPKKGIKAYHKSEAVI